VLATLVANGALGQKSGAGFYKKVGRDILKFDPAKGDYVPGGGKADEIVVRMLKKPAAERFKLLRESSNPQAQFLWSIFRDVWHYVALHLADIADNARDLDFAIRWGFGWNEGPFESWQAAGWKQIADWISEDIAAGKTLCSAPLPAWVSQVDGVHKPEGSYSAAKNAYIGRSSLPVYARQPFKQAVLGENAPDPRTAGNTVFEDESIRLWTAPGADDVLVASFKTKMNTIGPGVISGLHKAVELAEGRYKGVVVWQPTSLSGGPFSAGADLQSMMPAFMAGGPKAIEPEEKKLQDMMLTLRYAQVPVVAAVSGIALGGGTELSVYCAKRVVHFESYMGLVEMGVGLIPGGGGLTYLARVPQSRRRAATSCISSRRASRLRPWPRWASRRWKVAIWAICCPATPSSCMPTNCCTWPWARRGRCSTRAIVRRCRARLSRCSDATAWPPSARNWSTCATAASSPPTTTRSPRASPPCCAAAMWKKALRPTRSR
jgi:3-hydroxyacyl-CoA dehydrogenase (EC 1.1.1.35)